MKKLHCSFFTLLILLATNLQAQNWWDWSAAMPTGNTKVKLDRQNNFITIAGWGYNQWAASTEYAVKKYNRNGMLQWKRQGTNVGESMANVAVDDSGNIYTAGINLDSSGNIYKLDPDGNKLWSLNFPGDMLVGMNAAGDGSLYIAGTFYVNTYYSDTIRFQGYKYPIYYSGSYGRKLLIAKINPSGIAQWFRVFQYPNQGSLSFHAPVFSSIARDNNNHLYLSGGLGRSNFILDRDTIYGDFMSCGFLMQLNDTNGYANWGKKIPTIMPSVNYNTGGVSNFCYVALKNNSEIFLGGDDGYTYREFVGGTYGYQRAYMQSYYMRTFDTAGNELANRHYTEAIWSLIKKGSNYYTHGNDTLGIMDSSGNFIKRSGTKNITNIAISQVDETIGAIAFTADRTPIVCKYLENRNRVSGYVFKDNNNNGTKDSTEQGIAGVLVGEMPNRYIAVSDRNGHYDCYVDSGTHIIQPLSGIRYNSCTPATGYTVNFTGFGDTAAGKDFACAPIPGIHDVEINLTPYSRARPGFTTVYAVHIKNNGTATATGTAGIKLPTGISFAADTNFAAPVFSSADSVAFQFSNLQPQTDTSFTFKCRVSASLAIGHMLTFYSTGLPAINDSFPADNYDTLLQRVGGSFDPNDKMVFPDGNINIAQKDKLLTYVIRFQNTGNDTAFNVHVIDTLTSKLDIASLQSISSSHPVTIKVEKNNVLHFYFDNINLVDSVKNESLSHGFIRFKIKPAAAVTIGDTILNKGFIYFDYNAPVVTNTTSTKYFSIVLPVNIRLFTASKNSENVLLTLQAESNMKNFEVERSSDGLQFTTIGQVQASMLQHTYNFIDRQPLRGMNYYRLKLYAADGNVTYTHVQIVQFAKNKSLFTLYPNPATDLLYISTAGKAVYKIYNEAGQVVIDRKLQGNTPVDISQLASGAYYIELTRNKITATEKFVKR